MIKHSQFFAVFAILIHWTSAEISLGQIGDPQLGTDHPWYSGELTMSTFDRLFSTQAKQYAATTKRSPESDQDKALASWYFRNTHYAHGEEGKENVWGKGFSNDAASTTRDYWTGLFAHGYGLCGTTHAQWTAELDTLLGHCRSRVTGTNGHNSFEVFLSDPAFQDGKWAMLDHDLSTVVFDRQGKSLLGIEAISKDWKQWASRTFEPQKQNGWLVCGLHPGDGESYSRFQSAEYLAGYAGPPPIVQLRRGESLRRYFAPGLADGKTYVFWGRNYLTKAIPGPERSRTWVNQPESMFQSQSGTPHRDGQWRFGNAEYTWKPQFHSGAYRDGLVDESDSHVTLEFFTPYIIAATPPNDQPWGIYDAGCTNGLVLFGSLNSAIDVSIDGGHSWQSAGAFRNAMDLTDFVKGYRQYQIRIHSSASELANRELTIRTVCQLNPAILPKLKDGGSIVEYQSSGLAVSHFGPNKHQAAPYVIDGAFDSKRATLRLPNPQKRKLATLYWAAQWASSNPPNPSVHYQTEYSLDNGKTWNSCQANSSILRQGTEPKDFWSQSMWHGSVSLGGQTVDNVQVRFRNDGGKQLMRAEGHMTYHLKQNPAVVVYSWSDDRGMHTESQTMNPFDKWTVPTGKQSQTNWVEIRCD